ncbi:Conserved oligomeric Golgi complex subunit 2 [Mortierella claussenii]|nr:Conserved oligomeric Golgi complex subunit 2 [Mortierella claussenii]
MNSTKSYTGLDASASGVADGAVNSDGSKTVINGAMGKKPSHLSIDSNTANSAFIHTLNAQLQIAANRQDSGRRQQSDASVLEDDFPLTAGFDRAALIAPDFNTDEFLSARRHLPLEELKSQLVAHLKELKTELIELINSDYADFINLSTNLNGVDCMMEDIRRPLDKMKDDATAVKFNLQSVIDSLEQKLQHRAEIRDKKTGLQLLLNISESVAKVEGLLHISGTSEASSGLRDGESISVAKRLERVAIEYNQMQYLVSKGAGLPFVNNIDWRLVRIKETMSENLSNVLRSCILPAQQTEGDTSSNNQSLSQCLRTYALIDQTSEAEKIITEDLLAPFINKTISRSTLSELTHTQHTGAHEPHQRPLAVIYSRVLNFINDHCSTLINITQKELKGTNFDITVNCIWGVSSQAILKNIPQILAPGIPDVFHPNYTDTMAFVTKLEELCRSRKSLVRLRSLTSYQAFMKSWLLDAYFQIRFQNMATSIEDAFQANGDTSQRLSDTDEHLPASQALVRVIERCWSPDVFIYGIASRFWRFTLQLMTRYSTWIAAAVAKDLDMTREKAIQSRSPSPAPGSSASLARHSGRATPVPGGSLRPPGPVGRTSLDEMMLQQLSMIANDIDYVTSRIQEIFEKAIQPKLPSAITEEPALLDSFHQCLQAIRQYEPSIQQGITDLITKQCSDALVNVKSINVRASEGVPKEPSHFVPLILTPLSRYISGSGSVLKRASRDAWAKDVIAATTKQYSTLLAGRLLDIKRSEEATNKLKAHAKSGGGLLSRAPVLPNVFSAAGTSEADLNMSTSDKLRLQFVLDVQCYESELKRFNIETGTFQPFVDLEANASPFQNLLAAPV